MEEFVKGDVVVVPFPFSDLSEAKRRPALVIADLAGDDFVLCQITSRNVKDSYSIPLDEEHFEVGSLNRKSKTLSFPSINSEQAQLTIKTPNDDVHP